MKARSNMRYEILSHVRCTIKEVFIIVRNSSLYILYFLFFILHFSSVSAQKANKAIQKGNEAYRKANFSTAIKDYTSALQADAKNDIARFNLSNAFQHSNDAQKALQGYDDVVKNTSDAGLQSKAYYNKALLQLQQKNLAGAIDAFKQSLRLTPNDNEARENLQKALEEMKQQQTQQQNQKPPPQQPPKKQKPQQKMNQQMTEQKFKELQEQEKQLQKEIQKQKTNQGDPEKDW